MQVMLALDVDEKAAAVLVASLNMGARETACVAILLRDDAGSDCVVVSASSSNGTAVA
jgi:hypothetical protein